MDFFVENLLSSKAPICFDNALKTPKSNKTYANWSCIGRVLAHTFEYKFSPVKMSGLATSDAPLSLTGDLSDFQADLGEEPGSSQALFDLGFPQ